MKKKIKKKYPQFARVNFKYFLRIESPSKHKINTLQRDRNF